MGPKDIVAVGVTIVLASLLLTLLTSIWIVPIGLFISLVGALLYLLKRHHERRMDSERRRAG
ncbi:hypothetical protein [Halorubrum sp. 2020YC2]|uniref:hypothetical protein n=1 Tax=Halorubrum sp. 2020YC2 TaxID=2836432 RepID=UPI001BE9212D|nr:hypothetical protein [Halorubrum sp. 2020YC2]QWC20208.1 hypothetical protein KI388_04455 [Halorubrum sp. 2020YC2]